MEAILRRFSDSQKVAIVFENLTSLTARRIYWWIIVVFVAIIAIIFKNSLLLWITVITGAFLLAAFVWQVFIIGCLVKTREERKKQTEEMSKIDLSTTYFFEPIWRWIFVYLFLAAMVAGSFVMYRNNSDLRTDTYAVIHHHFGSKSIVGAGASFSFFVPYLDKVENYSADQTIWLECVGQTKDSIKVRANLKAELALDAKMLSQINCSQSELRAKVQQALKRRLSRTVSNFALSEMPPSLVLEYHTGMDKAEIEELGLRYNGVIAISDIHVFLN